MALNERLRSRLLNWKFEQALQYLSDDDSENVQALVRALAASFGDSGWFDGSLGTIIGYALHDIGADQADGDEGDG